MPIEQAMYIDTLQPDWPTGTDPESAGDDHLRMIKQTLKNTFPSINAPITGTPTQINDLTGHIGYTDISAVDPSFPNYLTAHNDDWTASIPLLAQLPSVAALNELQEVVINWSAVINLIYPVGSVISNTGTNPGTILGFGTWEARPGAIYGVGHVVDNRDGATAWDVPAGAVGGALLVDNQHIRAVNLAVTVDGVADHDHAQRAWIEGGGSNTYIDRNTYNNAGCEDNTPEPRRAGLIVTQGM